MGKIKYPLKATTFNQFKQRYILFTTFFGAVLIVLYFVRGYTFDLWKNFPFHNSYQILSILLIIFYVIVAVFIYQMFKNNYYTNSG